MTVMTERELAAAIKARRSEIVIEGDLAKKVVKIKATGAVAWVFVLGAIAVGVATALPTGGFGSVLSGGAAVAILGVSATQAALAIAVAAGGIAVLKNLHGSYRIVSKAPGRVVLRR